MYQLSALMALLAIAAVSAVPLNINLGAYSPALVVGDGEISFAKGTDVSQLMSTLQSSTPSAGATAAVAAGTKEAIVTGTKEAILELENTPKTVGKEVVPVKDAVPATAVSPPPIPAAPAAPQPPKQSPDAQQASPEPPAPVDPSSAPAGLFSGKGLGPDKNKKFILPRDEVSEAQEAPDTKETIKILKREIASMREDMAEAVNILKRDMASMKEGKPVESVLTPRDLAGFQAALNFATAAMKISPPIELGTGEGGSGVGIKVGSGASGSVATAPSKAAKRGVTAIKVVSKRSPSESDDSLSSPTAPEVDAVNLNLGDQAGAVSLTITEI